MRPAPRRSWVPAGDLVGALRRRLEFRPDRMSILEAAWPAEAGALARHWRLAAVKGGTLYVRPSSSAAAQELRLRAPALLKKLNARFNKAWITAIRAVP